MLHHFNAFASTVLVHVDQDMFFEEKTAFLVQITLSLLEKISTILFVSAAKALHGITSLDVASVHPLLY
jgi:hypothetical protein